MKRWIFLLVVALAILLVGGAGYLGARGGQAGNVETSSRPQTIPVMRGDVRQTVTAPGELIGTRQAMLSLGVSGRLAAVNVRAGDHVEERQVLAELELADLERAVADAEIELRKAQLSLEKLQEPPGEADVRQAEHAIDQAAAALRVAQMSVATILDSTLLNETLEDAQKVFDDLQHKYEARLEMYESGQEPDYWLVYQAQWRLDEARLNLNRIQQQGDVQLQDARNKVSQAQQDHREAQDDLEQLLEGADSQDVEAARLEIAAAELALEKAQDDLEGAVLVAPFGGVVLDVEVNAGEKVTADADLVLLADPANLEAELEVIEEDLPLVQMGQPVDVFFDALPEALVQGQVERIVPLRISDERPLYAVYVALGELPASLAPGMTIDASFIVDERADVLRLPRALVRARSDGTAVVPVWVNGRVEERSIQVGLRGDVYVEILSGLNEGDEAAAE
jgi:RND family efflux transporter MFP subunit